MLFRYWNKTICIDYEDIDSLERRIIQLLQEEEGYYHIHQLPKLNYDAKQLRVKPWKKLPNLWIIALFKSQSKWTVIKTFPSDLFCRPASGFNHLRLSTLTKRLNCKSFYLDVHHDNPEFLLESNSTGDTFLSGCPGAESSDDIQLYGKQVDLSGLIHKFSLIKVSNLFQTAMKINEDPQVKRQKVEADKLMKKIEPWQYEEFDLIKEACRGHTERIDRKLAEIICDSNPFWYIKNLAYDTYINKQKLVADNIRLLYFHSPENRDLKCFTIIGITLAVLIMKISH